jgi:hypothetical protein
MKASGADALFRRRSRAEGQRLVSEFEQSGMRRKEFCAAHGLSMHTLDAWRRRIAGCGSDEKIVPFEIVEDHRASMSSKHAGHVEWSGQFRVLLARIAVQNKPIALAA